DTAAIRQAITQTGAKLVILDPATSLMHGDLNKREDARRSLDALLAVAQDMTVTVVLIVHFGKGSGRASEKISGSHALRDAARSVLLFAADDETEQRVVSLDKNNYARDGSDTSFAFELLDTPITTDDNETAHVARVNYLGATDTSVNDIINRNPMGDDDGDGRNEAQDFILDYLEGQPGGEAPARDVLKAGRAAGFDEKG